MAKNKKKQRKAKQPAKMPIMRYLPPARHGEVKKGLQAAENALDRGDVETVLELCSKMLSVEPRNAQIHLTIAAAQALKGNFPSAISAYDAALKIVPNYPEALINYALMLQQAGLLEQSLSIFRRAVGLDDQFIPAIDGISRVLVDLRRYEQAVPYLEKLVKLRGISADYNELARVLDLAGNPLAALKVCSKALSVVSDKAAFHVLAGMISSANNLKDQAKEHFSAALAINPANGFANLYNIRAGNDSLDQLKLDCLIDGSSDKSTLNVLAPLHFAKARLYERENRFDESFVHYQTANSLIASVRSDDNDARRKLLEAQKAVFTREKIQHLHALEPDKNARSVFVTGLPRSGTTLVEQIITSHNQAAGLGELELLPMLAPSLRDGDIENIRTIAKSYRGGLPDRFKQQKRIVDKSISTLAYMGLVLAAFPNARIIYCERHPMDVAWSAYSEYFNDGSLAYTYSFERLAEHQQLYSEAIDHWALIGGNAILRVRYEDLVNDPETYSRRIINHTALDWQADCLNFHQSANPVRTASQTQVRRPVYTSSVGKWRSYEAHLEELKQLLARQIARYEQDER